MSKKVSKNSNIKDCPALPAGRVLPKNSLEGKSNFNVKLAAKAPASCAAMYGATFCTGNFFATANAILTAGLKCAPLTSPRAYINAITIKPKVIAMPAWVIAPPLSLFIIIAPVPQIIKKKVPTNSPTNFFILQFFYYYFFSSRVCASFNTSKRFLIIISVKLTYEGIQQSCTTIQKLTP